MTLIVKYWLPVLAWASLITTLSSIPSLGTGMPGTWDTVARKIGHVAEYAVLAWLLWRALTAHRLLWRPLWTATLVLAFAAGDEMHQTTVPGREGSPWDVAVDGLGLALWMAFYRLVPGMGARLVRHERRSDPG